MAKKKITTTTEEIEEETGIAQDIDYKKDIEDKTLKEIASETKGNESVTVKEDEEVKEPVKEIEEVKEEKPEVDVEKIAADAAKKTREEIADLLKGEEKKETKDAYQEWAEKYSEDNGKPPTWVEVAKFVKDTAKAEIIAEQQAQVKEAQEVQTKKEAEAKTSEDQLNSLIDEELNELYSSNKLIRIKNAEDPTDPGVMEKKALFQTMYEVNVKRAQEGKTPIYSVARIHSNYYKPVNKQPAGADAMITNNRAGGAPADDGDYEYTKDIRGKGWKSFFKR